MKALFLAPVAGYTSRAFRSICAELGAELCFTELVSAEAIVRNAHPAIPEQTARLLRRGDAEQRYAVQLFGASPDTLYRAASFLAPYKPDLLDLNAGCPVPKVTKTGAGSALMRNPDNLADCVAALVRASRDFLGGIPVSIKMRSGWDFSSINYLDCAAHAADAGASLITLHARTKTQVYEGRADWSHLANLVNYLKPRNHITVCGSGDLFAPEDAVRMFAETGCGAVMFARGALGNPFIFRGTRSLLATGSYTPAGNDERIATAFKELEMMSADYGEKAACLEMRKIFCAYTKGGYGAIGDHHNTADGGSMKNGARQGLRNGSRLRNQLVHASTIADYRAIFAENTPPGA